MKWNDWDLQTATKRRERKRGKSRLAISAAAAVADTLVINEGTKRGLDHSFLAIDSQKRSSLSPSLFLPSLLPTLESVKADCW